MNIYASRGRHSVIDDEKLKALVELEEILEVEVAEEVEVVEVVEVVVEEEVAEVVGEALVETESISIVDTRTAIRYLVANLEVRFKTPPLSKANWEDKKFGHM